MYRIIFCSLAVLALLSSPARSLAAPAVPAAATASAPPPQGYQDVEEPDEADDSMTEDAGGNDADTPPQTPAKQVLTGFQPGYSEVTLLGLNKVTGHASHIQAKLDVPVTFGALTITLHSCWKSAPDDRPDNAALLEIYEKRPDEAPERIFLGWMFSASPSISSLENPFYDITVIACEKAPAK